MNIVIFGATSAIAQEVGKLYASAGHDIFLVARNPSRLAAIAADLQIRGSKNVDYAVSDLADHEQHNKLINSITDKFSIIDVVLIAYGSLSNQTLSEGNFPYTLQELNTNLLSVISLLTELNPIFKKQRSGSLAILSSVAGDRGRQSNYTYGTAKAALNVYLQGLSHQLAAFGVNVLAIKPGLIDTPMTKDFKKNFLWVSPKTVAKDIIKAIQCKKRTIYTPSFWRYIMLIIKTMPDAVFYKTRL